MTFKCYASDTSVNHSFVIACWNGLTGAWNGYRIINCDTNKKNELAERMIIMDEKIKLALKNVYDNLTDEQKVKAKACKTEQELMDFAGKEGIELPDDLAEAVAGGLVYDGALKTVSYVSDYVSDSVCWI